MEANYQHFIVSRALENTVGVSECNIVDVKTFKRMV